MSLKEIFAVKGTVGEGTFWLLALVGLVVCMDRDEMSMPLVLCREDGRTAGEMEGTNERTVVLEEMSAVFGLGFESAVAFATGWEGTAVSLF